MMLSSYIAHASALPWTTRLAFHVEALYHRVKLAVSVVNVTAPLYFCLCAALAKGR